MNLVRSVGAIAGANGDGHVDWQAVANAAKFGVDPGDIDLSAAERTGYATDVRAARDRVSSVSGLDFDLPETVTVVNRHQWIDRNVETFARVMAPLDDRRQLRFGGITRLVNTGTMGLALTFLARKVLGQYDPVLLADDEPHALYVVHPNVVQAAKTLELEFPLFRRWIAFHEVTHAAEFGAAPWLSDHLAVRVEAGIEAMVDGRLDRGAFEELQVAMTAVEGYAELLMDEAFDEPAGDLREALERRRRSGGPIGTLMRHLFGLGMKRRQYELGRSFFETVVNERGLSGASVVWEQPENLPTRRELRSPERWMARIFSQP